MITSHKRPDEEARKVGADKRIRFTRHLRQAGFGVFGYVTFQAQIDGWKVEQFERTGNVNPSPWVSMRVRPEVTATLALLQKQHLEVIGKEISQSEVLSALVAAGAKAVSLALRRR
ncbi:hypothetical protein [Falsiruegeria mediterranea]|uniref:Uncharacterized protein n=1 Tax=Falsiruegeria mediterranea M17 TaxID=1200281 RepID=A0A2R8CCG9_9RHOB|nr:hypothetical protein [Falsiruegeria mediterranea]SPJ30126.1 hypothetical protein TRM7615_03654 [Falsiruegeria mediterranea M17]